MRVHRNAKTTPAMRQLIVTRARNGWTYAQIGIEVPHEPVWTLEVVVQFQV